MDNFNEPEDNYKSGYIKIFRSIKNHWLYEPKRKRTKLEAWYDLLLLAKHSSYKETLGYDLIDVSRGQILTSQDQLSQAWRWDRSSVRSFLHSLHLDQMLTIKTTNKYTMITICNYDTYQSISPSIKPTKQHQTNTTSTHTINDNKLKDIIKVDFGVFWDAYDKKKGDIKKVTKKWDKLSLEVQEKIISILPAWKNQFSDKQYQPFPETFINQERWNDEIALNNTSKVYNGKPIIDQSQNTKLYD